jgi:gamma-glutamylcyclotransferase (GGCT)/AIG2-like uncharacterized protein YtfP
MTPAVFLFVYGTLRRGHSPQADRLWSEAEFAGEAVVRGRIVPNGPYLGFLDGDEQIRGEVALLKSPDITLPLFDEYEGPDYMRVERKAQLDSGQQVDAWVYYYRGS